MKKIALYQICVIFLAIGFFSPLQSFGQSLKSYDQTEDQTIYINGKDSVLRFQTTEAVKIKHFDPALTYYWYKSNAILKTEGAGDGRLLNGDYTSFYADNNLKEKGRFILGLRTGVWIAWFENGKMRDLSHWKNGLLHGKHITYDLDGTVMATENYRKGKLIPSRGESMHTAKGGKTIQ